MKTARQKKNRIIQTILKKILLFLLILIAVYNLIYFVGSLLHIKGSFFGINFLVTDSSVMKPTINEKDLMITKKIRAHDVKKNDIILYKVNDEQRLTRVMYVRENRGVTSYAIKGDNNRYIQEMLGDNIEAKVIHTISGGKVYIDILRSAVLTLFIFVYIILFIRYKRRMELKKQKRRDLRQTTNIRKTPSAHATNASHFGE